MVHEADKAWHVRDENPYTVGYEHEGYIEETGWYTPAMYQSSADLTIDVCNDQDIFTHRMFYRDTLDDGTVLDDSVHVLAGSNYCTKIAGHQHYPHNSHTDPGPNWNWNYYYRLVNQGYGTTTTYTSESGTFYDTGGASGDYGNDERQLYLIKPDNAGQITLTFNSFDLEDNYDFLYIYDGDNVFAPLIGRWNTQSPGTVTSSGGALLVEFRSDCGTTAPGWQASWTSSTLDTIKPTTEIATTGGTWKTDDFTASFTDNDNENINYKFYQVIENDGVNWFANTDNGFFADNFDYELQNQWHIASGTWTVSDNELHQTDETLSNTNIFAELNQNDGDVFLYEIVAKVNGSNSNKRFGFHFFSDSGSLTNRGNSYFVWFRVDDQQLQFYKVTDDSFSLEKTIDNVVTLPDIVYDYKIIYNKNTGETDVYRNDVLIGSHTFSSPYTNGQYISLRTGNCQMHVSHIKIYHSRNNSETITVGSENTNDIQVQNLGTSTYCAKIKSIVTDSSKNISDIAYEELFVDYTPPSSVNVNDGTSDDIDIVSDNTQLSANWTSSNDDNSGIAKYWYSIGTSIGGSDIVDWTDNSTNTNVTVTGLSLQSGTTYYFNVKAENGAGLQSEVASSDGVVLQGSIFAGFSADDNIICVNDQVNFTNTSQNATSYLWTFEGGNPATSTETNPTVTYSSSGIYDVKLVAYGGSDSSIYELTDYIEVFDAPTANFSTTDTLLYLPNAVAYFSNLSTNASEYEWNFGDGFSSTENEPAHYYSSTGYFTVSLTARNQGCPENIKTIDNLIHVAIASNISDISNLYEISPNPFNQFITITFYNEKVANPKFKIFDMNGKNIQINYQRSSNKYILNIEEHLNSGIYILQIQTSDKIFYKKIIKM
jgi:PKD repeat protein